MVILGLNAYHGDASAAVVVDDWVVAAGPLRASGWFGDPRAAVDPLTLPRLALVGLPSSRADRKL